MDEVVTLDLPEFTPRTPTPQPLDAEMRTYTRLLPGLLAAHRGEYVAILGECVVGSGSDLFAILDQAYADHGYRPILCRLVTDQPRPVLHIPSVRVVRA